MVGDGFGVVYVRSKIINHLTIGLHCGIMYMQ